MDKLFGWLRLVRFVLGLMVLVLSVASGRLVSGPIDPQAALDRLVSQVAGFSDSTSNGEASEIEDEPLAEIEDEPIGGVVGDPDAPQGPPVSDVGALPGGALGGGVSSGPDGAVETPVIAPEPGVTTPTPIGAGQPEPITTPTPPQQEQQPTATVSPAPTQAATVPVVPNPTGTPAPTQAPSPSIPRLDDPALRFLPEILAASSATGVPPEILAGVLRVESNGDPNLIAVGRGRGLTGLSEQALRAQGVADSAWHDPAANLLAGARELAARFSVTGSWELALEQYFGSGCDTTGICPADYRFAVLAWASYYGGAVASPKGGAFSVLPPDWTSPVIAPYQGSTPRPLPLPPGVTLPTPTPAKTATPPPTATATSTMTPTPSETPTLTPTETPTVIPPLPPTETPSPVPTPTPGATG